MSDEVNGYGALLQLANAVSSKSAESSKFQERCLTLEDENTQLKSELTKEHRLRRKAENALQKCRENCVREVEALKSQIRELKEMLKAPKMTVKVAKNDGIIGNDISDSMLAKV